MSMYMSNCTYLELVCTCLHCEHLFYYKKKMHAIKAHDFIEVMLDEQSTDRTILTKGCTFIRNKSLKYKIL